MLALADVCSSGVERTSFDIAPKSEIDPLPNYAATAIISRYRHRPLRCYAGGFFRLWHPSDLPRKREEFDMFFGPCNCDPRNLSMSRRGLLCAGGAGFVTALVGTL